MLKLVEKDHGKSKELFKGELKEVVEYLQQNKQLYNWIAEEDASAEIPDLKDIRCVEDLNYQLCKVDLSWWSLSVN